MEEFEGSLDYVQFCGVTAPVKLLQPEERITAEEYAGLREDGKHILLDVRAKEHFDISHIPGSINIPINRFMSHRRDEQPDFLPELLAEKSIYVVCRVGNDSQIATKKLKDLGLDRNGERFIGDIKDGLKGWKETVDSTLPFV